jgi:GNAT superfamily N-acetyltransferase
MTVDFRDADLESLCAIYNRTVPDRYCIDELLLRQHTVDSPFFDWGASLIDPGRAFVAVKRSPSRLYRGPNPDVSHLCIVGFQDPTVLLDLLKEAKRCLVNRGVIKLQFGGENGHFFPGCPTDCHSIRDFLLIEGFEEGGESHDLERDLEDYQMPRIPPAGFEFRPVEEGDLAALNEFLLAEFPGRWHYDTFRKIEDEDDPGIIFGLFQRDKCLGFALTQIDGCRTQIGGAVWRLDLGKNWCSLGPIGVAKALRGKGCGGALLGTALDHLKRLGGRRCIIDWTGLVDFYGLHGFEVTRTYRSATLSLDPPRSMSGPMD